MRRFSTRNPLHTLAELNVTPLLDLCFVLLIIFMITTPLMENSVDLVVPSSATAKTQINPAETQIIQIDRNDTLKLNGQVTTRADLETQLTALKARDPANFRGGAARSGFGHSEIHRRDGHSKACWNRPRGCDDASRGGTARGRRVISLRVFRVLPAIFLP